MSTRYIKVLRDLSTDYMRNIMLVLAIAVGVFGIGTILGTYAILNREMSDNYNSTLPAAATLAFEEHITATLLDSVRNFPGIAAAERRATPSGRMQIGDRWYPILLFVIDDFSHMEVNRFRPVSGAREPAPGSILVERTALSVMQAQEGDSIIVRLTNGTPRKLAITGIVHDPGLAPAWQEQAGYAYISQATLKLLGDTTAGFDLLRIQISEGKTSTERITQRAEALAGWLRQSGHEVHEIQVPPPGQHPHQGQMNAVLSIFTVFSFMLLVLGSILVATAVATLMVRQVRHIGMMKTIGATSLQIGRLYGLMIVIICVLALIAGMPPSQLAATAFCTQIARLLNLEISDSTIPAWVLLIQAGSGILIPLLAAAAPVIRGSRMPIRLALDNHGVTGAARLSPWSIWISRTALLADIYRLALRNAFRQRARLALTLTLLAAGGAIFMTAINVSQAWDKNLERLYVQRLYDQQVQLQERIAADTLLASIGNLPGIKAVEGWDNIPTAVVNNSPYAITRTYPDKGHGSFTIQALPIPTRLLNLTITEGHWLSAAGSRDVVLNQLARKAHMKIGDSIRLMIDTQPTTWTIVGFTEDVGSPATAYVSLRTFEQLNGSPGRIKTLRVAYHDRSRESVWRQYKDLEQLLEAQKIGVSGIAPVWQLRNAVAAHMTVLINALLAMAVLMGIVGTLGLASTMSMSVLERTREIGVMRAIGATPARIRRLIAYEGVTIGLLSITLAFILALPISYAFGRFIGYISFKTALTLTVSAAALGGWTLIVITGSYLATVLPARRANTITTRQALAYE